MNESLHQYQSNLYRLALRSKSGFTMIELLVVFSIIIMLSGVGFASFSSYSKTQAVSQAKEDVAEAFRIAKFNAISSVKPSTCSDNDTLHSYQMQICENSGTCNSSGDYEIDVLCGAISHVVLSKKLPTGITFGNSTTCSTINYSAVNGIITSTPWPCVMAIDGYGQESTFNP